VTAAKLVERKVDCSVVMRVGWMVLKMVVERVEQ
jgi:hypothetical protein